MTAWLFLLVHDENVSASLVRVDEKEIEWKVDVGLQGLQKVVPLPAELIDLSEVQLQSAKASIVAYLLKGLSATVNEEGAALEAGDLEPVYEKIGTFGEPYIARVVQTFRIRASGPVQRVSLGLRLYSELTTRHVAVVTVSWRERTHVFTVRGARDLYLTYGRLDPTFWSMAGEFVPWGVEHIFLGYDHIAFLLALLLAARRMGELVKIVTSFTVAHSLTLILSALEVVAIPANVTESMIAASIVYVAVENFFLKEAKYRWALTFGFGLVHGLGFAGVVRERLPVDATVVPVLTFNVGVELGQLAILLAVFPLLVLARGASEERRTRILWAGSAAIMLFGLGWLVQRVCNLDFMPL